MTYSLNPGTTLRRLFLFAAISAAVGLQLAPPASAQTIPKPPPPPPSTWVVTISLTGTGTLTYQNTNSGGPGNTCSATYSSQPQTGPDLYVCQGDTVNWQVVKPPQSEALNHSEMYIVHHDMILHDSNNPGKHRQGFHGSNGTSDGGTIDSNASKVAHRYLVLVWDPDTQTPYFEDPKIMIGGSKGPGSKGHGHGQDKKSSSAQ